MEKSGFDLKGRIIPILEAKHCTNIIEGQRYLVVSSNPAQKGLLDTA